MRMGAVKTMSPNTLEDTAKPQDLLETNALHYQYGIIYNALIRI